MRQKKIILHSYRVRSVMSKLQVAESFYSIQGEGPNAGTPAVFLRLAGCNLQCGKTESNILEVDPLEDEPDGDATWICDTIDVWRQPDASYTAEEMYEEFKAQGFLNELIDKNAHLILTGGEPTLPQHQKAFAEFIDYCIEQTGTQPYVEVETNGTQPITDVFLPCVDLFNVSLKLSNSGHDRDERIVEEALTSYVRAIPEMPDVKFKFVVSGKDDLQEVEEIVREFNIPAHGMSLMPAGQTREQLQETYPEVAEMCKDHGWSFTGRSHVEIWNQQTGV